MKQVSLSFEWKSGGEMDNKTGEGDKDEMTWGERGVTFCRHMWAFNSNTKHSHIA